MVRDCDASNVWETSFIAVNLHPLHRISFEDWLKKISPFVKAAEKYDEEIVNLSDLLPKTWLTVPLNKRQEWMQIVKSDGESWDVNLLMKLRTAGMTLNHLSNIFKLYKAEQRIAATFSTPEVESKHKPITPRKVKQTVKDKGRMLYHLWKVPLTEMTGIQKLEHAITVRNRHLGPDEATRVSPHLDVAMSVDNKRLLRLDTSDLNMHKVLKGCNVKHGERRRVAKRALTMLGNASGMCGTLNGPEQLKEIKCCLKFADSLEQIRHAEKKRRSELALKKKQKRILIKKQKAARDAKRKAKEKKLYSDVLLKLNLDPDAQVLRKHVDKLTGPQLRAVAACQCATRLSGKVEEMRTKLKDILPTVSSSVPDDLPDNAFPEYPTQDMVVDGGGSGSDTTVSEFIAFDDLFIGDRVEVYWEGEHVWFKGEINDVDLVDQQFEINYDDGAKLWHNFIDYPVRSTK